MRTPKTALRRAAVGVDRCGSLLLTLLALGLGTGSLARAQPPSFVAVRPPADAFVVERDVTFSGSLRLDLYRPPGEALAPVVVFVNGVGSPDLKDWPAYVGWGEVSAAAGLAAVLYQSVGGRDAAVLDEVLAWVRSEAPHRRLDPERILLWSSSANVRTGLPAAMDPNRPGIRGAVVYYGDGPVDRFRMDLPVYLVRAGLDAPELNARIDALAARALQANAPWTIDSHGSGVHGFDAFDDDDLARDAIARTLAFMVRVARPEVGRAYVAGAAQATLGAAFAAGDWPTAVAGYRQRVAARPDEGESHRRLGLALLATGEPGAALAALEAAHRLGRGGVRDTVLPAAEAAARAGNVERAIHWLDVALASRFGPSLDEVRGGERFAGLRDRPELAALLAAVERERGLEARLAAGDVAPAIAELRSVEEGQLLAEDRLVALAYRLLMTGHATAAVEVFRLAGERYPTSANVWESHSEACEAAGEREAGIAAARRALALVDGDPRLAAAGRAQIREVAARRLARLGG